MSTSLQVPSDHLNHTLKNSPTEGNDNKRVSASQASSVEDYRENEPAAPGIEDSQKPSEEANIEKVEAMEDAPRNVNVTWGDELGSTAKGSRARKSLLKQKPSQVPESQKPAVAKSWDVLMKAIETRDGDFVKGYKEDIDTLLVFAGLFSAVVTAFTIESYKWLQADSADETVDLLKRISQQLGNQTAPAPSTPSLFIPSASVIRINTFWFFSLVLALVDALFGLLCKQWLREHRRQTNTHTPGDAFTLYWLRNQSFDRWHVRKILALLPILLEIALFFFFAGLLELLRSRHQIPFAVATGVVSFAALFYLGTTLLPGIVMIGLIIRQVIDTVQAQLVAKIPAQLDELQTMFRNLQNIATILEGLPPIQFLCPYKSPQSWAVFKLLFSLFRGIFHFRRLREAIFRAVGYTMHQRIHKELEVTLDGLSSESNFDRIGAYNLMDWSSVDLAIMKRFSAYPEFPDMYELKGLRWLVNEFRNSTSMKPHLHTLLCALNPNDVMPSVFDHWFSVPEGEYGVDDVRNALDHPKDTSHISFLGDPSSHTSTPFCQLLYLHRLWDSDIADNQYPKIMEMVEELWTAIISDSRRVRRTGFPLPFVSLERMFDGDLTERDQLVLGLYKRCWDSVGYDFQKQLINALSKHIQNKAPHDSFTPTSEFLDERLEFLIFVNEMLVEAGWFHYGEEETIYPWLDALHHAQLVPSNRLRNIPWHFPISLERLTVLLEKSTSDSVLVPLLKSFEDTWDVVRHNDRCQLLNALSSIIPSSLGTTLDLSHPSIPILVTSDFGLKFLEFVNDKLVATTWFHKGEEDTMWRWVNAMERVRLSRGLPIKHFEPVPERDDWRESGKIVGYYTPQNRPRETAERGAGSETINDEMNTRPHRLRSVVQSVIATSLMRNASRANGGREGGGERDIAGPGTSMVRVQEEVDGEGNQQTSAEEKIQHENQYNKVARQEGMPLKEHDEPKQFGGRDAENNV